MPRLVVRCGLTKHLYITVKCSLYIVTPWKKTTNYCINAASVTLQPFNKCLLKESTSSGFAANIQTVSELFDKAAWDLFYKRWEEKNLSLTHCPRGHHFQVPNLCRLFKSSCVFLSLYIICLIVNYCDNIVLFYFMYAFVIGTFAVNDCLLAYLLKCRFTYLLKIKPWLWIFMSLGVFTISQVLNALFFPVFVNYC